MEEVKETKVEEPRQQPPKKKKSRALYWIVVIVGAVFIFVASYNIGYKLGRLVETDNGSTKTESKEESNSNSNETSNVESNVTSNETSNKVEIEQKDAAYFNEYLKIFQSCHGENVTRNTTNFSDTDISNIVINYALSNTEKATSNQESEYEYKLVLSAKEVEELVYKYFNTKEFSVTNQFEITKLTKDGNNYIVEFNGFGCGQTVYKNPVVTYNDENVTVKYDLYDTITKKVQGTETFHLKYNNGNYNIIKIEK